MAFTDIPDDTHVLYSEDGRVFYDLDALTEQYIPVIMGFESKDCQNGGMAVIRAIQHSKECLALNNSFRESNV